MSIIVNNRINPTEGLVEYAKIVKPYHSKILDIDISYVYEEQINVEVIEKLEWDINQYTSDLDIISTCGWGVEWDPIRTTMDYPSVYIRRAYGEVEIEVEIDINTPNIIIVDNSINYQFNVGDNIIFSTKSLHNIPGILPTTTDNFIIPTKLYRVVNINNNIIQIDESEQLEYVYDSINNKWNWINKTNLDTPIIFNSVGSGKLFISPYNNNQNSFLVDKESSPVFDCIVSDVNFNTFTFVNVYNLKSVDVVHKKFIVIGDIRNVVPIGMTIYLRGNTGLGTEQKFTVYSQPILDSFGDTIIYVKEAISVKANNTGTICVALNEIIRYLSLTVMGFDNINNSFTVSGDHLTALSTGLIIEYEDGLLIKQHTILGTPTLDSNRNTVIKVAEPLDPFTTSTGIITLVQPPFEPWSEEIVNSGNELSERFWPTPSWQSGTKIKIFSNMNGLPYPLSDSDDYYFIPDQIMGRFKLAKTRYPSHRLDFMDISNYGIGTFSIKRSESFYPGATIQVTDSSNIRNNRYYTIKDVVEETVCDVIKDRVFVHQRIPNITTNIFDCSNVTSDPSINNDGKMSIVSTGWDFPSYCPNSQTDELYTDSLIQEDIVVDFEEKIQEVNGNQIKVVGDFINSIKMNNGNIRTCPTGIKPGNPLYIKDLVGNTLQSLYIVGLSNVIDTELDSNNQNINIIKTIFEVNEPIISIDINNVLLTIVEYPQITPYQHTI